MPSHDTPPLFDQQALVAHALLVLAVALVTLHRDFFTVIPTSCALGVAALLGLRAHLVIVLVHGRPPMDGAVPVAVRDFIARIVAGKLLAAGSLLVAKVRSAVVSRMGFGVTSVVILAVSVLNGGSTSGVTPLQLGELHREWSLFSPFFISLQNVMELKLKVR